MVARPWRIVLVVAVVLIAAACETPVTPTPSASSASPGPLASSTVAATPAPPASATPSPIAIDPSRFVATVDNPWYPLVPGTTLHYAGTKDGERVSETFEVTRETVVIEGVTCVVVHDNLYAGGVLVERTSDWFAQDVEGNVWYFGEDTAELDEDGTVVSTEGSWKAGVDGALPGIFMPASPAIGQSFQQELFPDHAQDRFVILQIGISVKVRFGSFDDAMLTAEWTVLEPDVIGTKTYVRGIGQVAEREVAGGDERLELVRIESP